MFASANATPNPVSGIYGTGVYWTTNAGTNWAGFNNPPFGRNSGDPAAAIGTNGYFYMGYITYMAVEWVFLNLQIMVLTGHLILLPSSN